MTLTLARANALAGQWADVLNLLLHVGDDEPEPEHVTLVAEALLRTARLHEAEAWLERRLSTVEKSGDRVARRRAIHLWGVVRFELGHLSDAEAAFRRAAELGEQEDDPRLVAQITNNLAQIANLRGRPLDALVIYQLAVPAYQRLGDMTGLAATHHNMAISHRDLGQLDRADECERHAIELATTANATRLAALARIGRAELALRRRETGVARVAAHQGATECASLGDPAGAADGFRVLGLACIADGAFDDAAIALERASAFATRHGNPLLDAETLCARAELASARAARSEAWDHAHAALMLFERMGATVAHRELEEWCARLVASGD